MTKITILLVITCLSAILLASPITDKEIEKSSLLSGESPPTFPGGIRIIPLNKPQKVTLDCPKEGFFSNPEKCSDFYQCVSIPRTAYFRIYDYHCPKGEVFSQELNTCVPGECAQVILEEGSFSPPNLQSPLDQPHDIAIQDKPYLPPPFLPEDPFQSPPGAPAPPPPSGEDQIPTWFQEGPWWFKTPPAWFNQPPAWFNAPPTSLITNPPQGAASQGEIVIEETLMGQPPSAEKGPFNTGEITIDGVGSSLMNDNRTIRIHVPINIIQQ